MQWLTVWLSKNGKNVVMALIVAFAAANSAYPFVDPHIANTILAVAAALGLYSAPPKGDVKDESTSRLNVPSAGDIRRLDGSSS